MLGVALFVAFLFVVFTAMRSLLFSGDDGTVSDDSEIWEG